MPVYLVERVLRGATLESLDTLRARTEEACRISIRQGKEIRYLHSTFTPGESRCQCVFQARSSELVRQVNDASGFHYERIVLAVDLGAVESAEHAE